MRNPETPPNFDQLFQKALASKRINSIFQAIVSTISGERYFHWDELRFRTPPAVLSHEEWWLGLKLRRMSATKPITLLDKTGQPFGFHVPDLAAEQLHHIDRESGTLLETTTPITNPQTRDRYIMRSLVEEAITSSQLEGAATTREVAKQMLSSGRPPRDRGEQMILNNFLTMRRIIEIKHEKLSPALVLDIHRRVSERALDKADAVGRLRRADESVQVSDSYGQIFHEPPAAGELDDRLREMCRFANGETPDFFVHPVIRAILLHFWLAYDHPFVDGNGRTARALFYWQMLHAGYWLFEFVSISQFLLKAPALYGMAFLHTETDANDLTYFVIHQTEVIRRALAELHDYIRKKSHELEICGALLNRVDGLSHRQQAVIAHALRHPGFRYEIAGHQHRQQVAYATARFDLLDLAQRGLLEQSKAGNAFVFIVPEDLELRLRSAAKPAGR